MTHPGLPGGEPLEPLRRFDVRLEHAHGQVPVELERWQRDFVARAMAAGLSRLEPTEGLDLVEQLREWQRQIDAAPPVAARIRASHAVPYGQVFRQWNTRGALELWVNRGWVADLPRAKHAGIDLAISELVPPGIPVFNEDR